MGHTLPASNIHQTAMSTSGRHFKETSRIAPGGPARALPYPGYGLDGACAACAGGWVEGAGLLHCDSHGCICPLVQVVRPAGSIRVVARVRAIIAVHELANATRDLRERALLPGLPLLEFGLGLGA